MALLNNKIDVIIPAYNVDERILMRCLSSIVCQSILNDLEITIVDDASDKSYNSIYKKAANRFRGLVKIKVLRYEKNGGPGVARQYGIDNTHNEFITFIDADDTYNGSFALQILRNVMHTNNGLNVMVIGSFDEVVNENTADPRGPILIPKVENFVWMFGKLYRRCFIEKYDIRFHPTSRANEDSGFNTFVKLMSNEKEQIAFTHQHVYHWHENENSITRINNAQYTYGSSTRDSFYGLVENSIYAIKEAKKRDLNEAQREFVTKLTIETLINLYVYYLEVYTWAKDHLENNFKWCKLFYNEIYKDIENNISKEKLEMVYSEIMIATYKSDTMNRIVPHITIYQFLEMLKK